ncbi:MAG: LLM class flavin-dependent oxidoreductase [Candidatus Bathyarchaeota archaeon]|nr:LLM class flavin-dependent oxidoreductase [Candidatus Bathyarchaeota archaeon]MCX8177666.1 LLM class flavin-dependent oxidoreductase [Candidatus Bathyarchaeota archaeon]MDW8193921.1 LLM class flavin-dependent oxidoreductase [Nitrososphaerota archaeon]
MQRILLDVGVTSFFPWKRFVQILKAAGDDAFNTLWIGEDINGSVDVFVQALFALSSTRLNVGIGITSIYFHKLVNIARAAASLSEVSLNRFRLGIGVGSLKILSEMGIPIERPVSTMREAAFLLRKIWNEERTTFNGSSFVFNDYIPHYRPFSRIPLYFGVRGRKLLELAGEIADGVIISGPKTYIRKAIELFRSKSGGADKRIVVWLPTILIERKEDLDLAKEAVVVVLADTPQQVIRLSSISPEEAQVICRFYIQGDMKRAIELVSDEIMDEMLFYGSAQEICEAFTYLETLGVHEVVFGPPFGRKLESSIMEISKAWSKTN